MEEKLKDVGRSLEKEVQKFIAYVNDRIVPAAREDTHLLLRKAARELDRLADKLEKGK